MSPIAQAILVYAVIGAGLLVTLLTGAAQFRELSAAFRGKPSDALVRRGFLAASVGMGSVGGSILALELGGPGAIGWMWVASLLGMALIYAEVRLSLLIAKRRGSERVATTAIFVEHLPPGLGRALAVVFAIALMIFAIAAGSVLQTQQSSTLLASLGAEPQLIVLTLVAASFVGVAVPKLRTFVAALGPVAVVLYVFALVLLIVRAPGSAGEALSAIVSGTFGSPGSGAIAGGAAGGGLLVAMQAGFLRATLATEAGLGGAGFTPEADGASDPSSAAASAMLAPLVSGILVPTLTALTVMTTSPVGHSGQRIDEAGERRAMATQRTATPGELQELADALADGKLEGLSQDDRLRTQAAWVPLERPQTRGTAGSLQTGQTVILPKDAAIDGDAPDWAVGLRRNHVYPLVMRANPRGTKAPIKEGENWIILRAGPETETITELVFRDKDPKRRDYPAYDVRVPVEVTVAGPAGQEWVSLKPTEPEIDLYMLSKVRDGPYVAYGDFPFEGRVVSMFHQKWGEHDAIVAAQQNEWRPLSLRTTVGTPSFRGPYLDAGEPRPPLAMIAREGFSPPLGSRMTVELRSPERGLDVGQLLASGEYITPPWRFLAETTHAVLRHKEDPAKDIRIPVEVEIVDGYLRFVSGDRETADFAKAARWRDYTGPYLDAVPYAFEVEVHSGTRAPASQRYLTRNGLERSSLSSPYAERRTLVAVHPEGEPMGSRRELYDPHPAEVAPFMDGPWLSHRGIDLLSSAAQHGLGHRGDLLLALSVLILALTTMVAWSGYGARAADFALGQGAGIGFRVVFGLAGLVGLNAGTLHLLRLVDHTMLVLIPLNAIALVAGLLHTRKR